MDHQRFDRLSRSLAMRTTRRQAVRQVGAGSVLGGVAAVLGVKALQAQGAEQTCALQVYAEVYVGPWLGTVYEGTLSLDMDAAGAIGSGSFDTLDGASYPLVGQATGRGLDLRVDLGNFQSPLHVFSRGMTQFPVAPHLLKKIDHFGHWLPLNICRLVDAPYRTGN